MSKFGKLCAAATLIAALWPTSHSSAQTVKRADLATCADLIGGASSVVAHEELRAEYLRPNELNPHDARSLVGRAGAGVYAGVGSERVLFDYLMAKDQNVRLLLALDRDAGIVQFHVLNRILLSMVDLGDAAAYQHFRFKASLAEWEDRAKAAQAAGLISDDDVRLVSDHQTWRWWSTLMSDADWRPLLRRPIHPRDPYYGVTYMADAEQLRRLQQLARTGRYRAMRIDLAAPDEVHRLVRQLADARLSLAFLDLSNAYLCSGKCRYLTLSQLAGLLRSLNAVGTDETLVMTVIGCQAYERMWYRTYSYKSFRDHVRCLIESGRDEQGGWEYSAYQFSRESHSVLERVGWGQRVKRAQHRSRLLSGCQPGS